jgi:hypothetical protein
MSQSDMIYENKTEDANLPMTSRVLAVIPGAQKTILRCREYYQTSLGFVSQKVVKPGKLG